MDVQDKMNHAATTRYLQPRRLQVLLFSCHQKTSSDTASMFLAFELLQAPARHVLLPSRAVYRQRTLRVCMHGHTCACLLRCPGQAPACTDTWCAFGVGSWDAIPPAESAARTQTRSRSQPRGLAGENRFLGRALTVSQVFVVMLRGWAGVAARLRALLFDFLSLLYHPELGAIAPTTCGDSGWGWRQRQLAPAARGARCLIPGSQRRWAGTGQGSWSVVVPDGLLHLKAEGLVET